MTTWVVPDFETVSCCDLKKSGAWRYWEDPTTEIICLAFKIMPAEEVVLWYPGDPIPPRIAALMADEKVPFIAHNADFEKAGWRHRMVPEYGWPDIPNRRWHDTAARART
jgi:DNA polymerase